MSIKVIPLQPIPNQTVSYMLDGVSYVINVDTLRGQLYISVWQAGIMVLANRVLRSFAPVGFGLQMADTTGGDALPHYSGLGTQWLLMALSDE